MNILIDIGHPAHVHLFKNFIWKMKKRGNKVIVTAKDSFMINYLLKKYNINYINLGKKGSGLFGKTIKQFIFDLKILFFLYKFKIDKAMGTSISISHACLFHKSKSYVFNEDNVESAPLFAKSAYPFADYIITPKCLNENHGKKHIQISSLHELAYLHPDNFKPDKKILKELNVKEGEKFFILRFNAFKAHHDKGIKGLSLESKRKLINLLDKHGKIFITSEEELGKEFNKYKIKIDPAKIHHALYYAHLFIGDSNSMMIEAAVLGTPAVRCNDFVGRCPVIEELEHKYGLTYGFKPKENDKMFIKIKTLLKNKNLKKEWQQKREKLLKDKIDLTKWMVDFIEKQN